MQKLDRKHAVCIVGRSRKSFWLLFGATAWRHPAVGADSRRDRADRPAAFIPTDVAARRHPPRCSNCRLPERRPADEPAESVDEVDKVAPRPIPNEAWAGDRLGDLAGRRAGCCRSCWRIRPSRCSACACNRRSEHAAHGIRRLGATYWAQMAHAAEVRPCAICTPWFASAISRNRWTSTATSSA